MILVFPDFNKDKIIFMWISMFLCVRVGTVCICVWLDIWEGMETALDYVKKQSYKQRYS